MAIGYAVKNTALPSNDRLTSLPGRLLRSSKAFRFGEQCNLTPLCRYDCMHTSCRRIWVIVLEVT